MPANLSSYGPERSALAPLAKTAQALVAEIRALSMPVCTDPRYGADAVEDDSTNAALGARRLTGLLGRLRRLLALEAVAAAQAVDLAAPAVLGRGPELLHRAIRKVVPRLDEDRPCGADVERVAQEVLGATAVQETVRALLTPPLTSVEAPSASRGDPGRLDASRARQPGDQREGRQALS